MTCRYDRAAGALVGAAVGDALGAGFEFTYPDPAVPNDMVGGGVFGWAPGEWTDDTAMTIAVGLAAAETGTLHEAGGLDAVASRFVEWWDSKPRDVGKHTARVLVHRNRSAQEMACQAATLAGRAGGNGSLMRTAPVGLLYLYDTAATCATAAAAVSGLTHADQRASEACILWSLAVRTAVLTGTYDGLREGLAVVDQRYWKPILDAAQTSASPAGFPDNGWVVHALQTAWWAICHSETLPGALQLAIRAGGDTDTTASIAGSLLGARWGLTAIPTRWQHAIHGYPGMRASDLVALAHRITTVRQAV